MKFTRYPSIENHDKIETVVHILKHEKTNQDWVVQEKIHGCNFGLHTDGEKVKTSKRSGFLGELENFHSSLEMLNRYKDNMLALYARIVELNTEGTVKQVSVYGELFGGHYEGHKDKNYKRIQSGVYYTPKNEFLAFDLKIVREIDGEEVAEYQDWVVFTNLLNETNIPHIPELKRGTFSECMEHPYDFQTTIPAMFGYEPMNDNVCEGVIIRPTKQFRLDNGNRPLLKLKNEKFLEKGKVDAKKFKNEEKAEISAELLARVDEFKEYMTENRLHAVISKNWDINALQNRDISPIVEAFLFDAVRDYKKDKGIEEITKGELRVLKNFANPFPMVVELIKSKQS